MSKNSKKTKPNDEIVKNLIDYQEGESTQTIYKNIIDKFPKTPIDYAYSIAKSLCNKTTTKKIVGVYFINYESGCIWDSYVGIPQYN